MFTEQSYNFDNTLEDFVKVNYRNCVILVEECESGLSDTGLLFTINFSDTQYQITDQVSRIDELIDAWNVPNN